MADKTIQLSVKVNTETGQLEVLGAKFNEVGKKAEAAGGSFKGLGGEAKSLLASFLPFATAGGIAAFFTAAVKGAEEENEALRRLKFTVESTGQSWDRNRQSVEDWAGALQAVTRFSDTDALNSLDKLTRATGNVRQAQSAATLAMNLSVASGKDLAATTQLVNDLITKQERGVSLANKEFGLFAGGAKTAQEALDNLSRATKDAALNEESLTKQLSEGKNALAEFSDQIGRTFSPAIQFAASGIVYLLKLIENLGQVIATNAAAIFHTVSGVSQAVSAVLRGDFSSVKRIASETIASVKTDFTEGATAIVNEWNNKEQAQTQIARQGAEERIAVSAFETESEARAREELARKAEEEAQKVEALELELNQRLAALGEETFNKKKAMLDAESAARRAKINREIADETAKARLLQKVDLEHAQRTTLLVRAESKMKSDAAFKVASDSLEALSILNSMQEGHSKEEARRAKMLLALQQALAIANLWRAEAGKGMVGIAMASAGTAVILAQFAQQSKAIDKATSAASQGGEQFKISTELPGGSTLDEIIPSTNGASAGGGSVFAGSGSPAGASGGGSGAVIMVGGITVNFSADHVDISQIEIVARRLAEVVRGATTEGVQLALAVRATGERNAGLAI